MKRHGTWLHHVDYGVLDDVWHSVNLTVPREQAVEKLGEDRVIEIEQTSFTSLEEEGLIWITYEYAKANFPDPSDI